ncbi:MAG: apolipoprotein N-acyltransferase [Gammaproteobacteria bacterium HGW-Gammaproteobacteria-3]|nr:MAG: apolipoprotein N-acyltransferase [Gammaproteobacteria bacterium HGW-Gammaproteobacteria-3]
MTALPSKQKSPWLLPVLSGIFIGTSYIPFPPWAALFCFVPLWLFWERQSRLGPVLLSGFLTTFVYTLIGFNWVTYTLHEFAQVNWFVAAIGMVLFALFGHLFVPVAGLLWFFGRKLGRWPQELSFAAMAVLTALCELSLPMLFKWNFGYSWYGANMPLYQWAEIIGFSGLSMLTILLNWPLLLAWRKRRARSGKLIPASVAVVFLGLNLGGMALKNRLPKPDDAFNTLLVQANIGNIEKQALEHGRGFQGEILHKYEAATDLGLSSHADRSVDFVLWSETAFPALLGGAYNDAYYARTLKTFLRARNTALLTGAYAKDEDGRITNSLFAVDKNGSVTEPHYSKTLLLALGEYIPFEQTFPWLRTLLPMVGNFGVGPGPTVLLKFNGYKIGPQICYESLFPEFSIALADLGAQFIVNVTNDSWYGTWQEPYQHMYMTLARGVELRRPVVRVTNTGISTVALASGEVLQQSPMNQTWAGFYNVPFRQQPSPTFYQQNFLLMPTLLWLALLGVLVSGFFFRRR